MRARGEGEAAAASSAFWEAAAALMGPDGVSVGELPPGLDLDEGGHRGLRKQVRQATSCGAHARMRVCLRACVFRPPAKNARAT